MGVSHAGAVNVVMRHAVLWCVLCCAAAVHASRQVLRLKRSNHQLQQQATALQEELDAIMALELDDVVTPGPSTQQQQQQQSLALLSGPAAAHRVRPMTAGPLTGSSNHHQHQHQQQRPLSGSPNRHRGDSAGAVAWLGGADNSSTSR